MILQLDAALHANIFKELGETLMKRQLWELALDCWDALHEQSVGFIEGRELTNSRRTSQASSTTLVLFSTS